MIKTFKTCKFDLNGLDADEFIDNITNCLPSDWERDREREENIKPAATGVGTYYCFTIIEGNKLEMPVSTVYLISRSGQDLKVANITSSVVSELGVDRYNVILSGFYDIVRVLNSKVDVHLSSGQEDLEDWLSPESAEKLKRFSNSANKAGLHPSDNERWFDFVISTVEKDDDRFTSYELKLWLKKEGWYDDEVVMKLGESFDNGQDLLKYFCQWKGIE